jgi:hypothetical protein
VNEPVRPDDMRVSDAERNKVQDQLKRAHDAGQLDLNEFDERIQSVWAARTRGQLEKVTADLPNLPVPRAPGARAPAFTDTPGGIAMRVLTIIWASLTVVNLAVWGMISLTTAHLLYPWWAWVAIPPGAVLAVLYTAGIGRQRREG